MKLEEKKYKRITLDQNIYDRVMQHAVIPGQSFGSVLLMLLSACDSLEISLSMQTMEESDDQINKME